MSKLDLGIAKKLRKTIPKSYANYPKVGYGKAIPTHRGDAGYISYGKPTVNDSIAEEIVRVLLD